MIARKKDKILVLGSTGKIGSVLVTQLATDAKTKVVAAGRSRKKLETFETIGVETRIIDLDEPERTGLNTMVRTFEDVEQIFLLTGYDVAMLAQSKAVIDAARRADVQHIVHMGTYPSDDTTIVHLGWHRFVECYLEASGISWTHLRPNWFLQNLLSYAGNRGQDSGVIRFYIDKARVGWVDTDDIASVAAAALRDPAKHSGKAYPLAVEALSFWEVAEILSEVVGRPYRYEPLSPEEFFNSAVANGADPAYMRCVKNVFERTENGSLPEAADTFDNIEAITGKKPTSWHMFAQKHRDKFMYS